MLETKKRERKEDPHEDMWILSANYPQGNRRKLVKVGYEAEESEKPSFNVYTTGGKVRSRRGSSVVVQGTTDIETNG